ncbi:efflux RND transporter periplasmic adaptor subunit [Helicobacter bizzozeronii]|uniref:hypothetical protein n=1 Tax=Helicobacter bizzozeronii TaxID=56877 RepID=UPI000CEF0E2C|nr:hypothetical protein [Helicobacter bizzozeronii]
MSENPLKTQFLDLLQDEEVQEAMFAWLKKMFASSNEAVLEQIEATEQRARQEMQKVQAELQGYKTQLATLEQDLLNLQEADRQKQAELEHTHKALKQAQAELEKHKIKAYALFLTLPASLKQGLSNLFKEGDPLAFVVIGTQGKNIEMLWDYTNNALKENKEGAQILVEIFYSLFGYYAKATPYKLDPLEVGQTYDPTKHQRHHSSTHSSGAIAEVLLRGFKHARTGEVKRQSVVKI